MNEKILDKIRKLLALAGSDNPGEAENALLLARKLMAQHKVTESDLSEKKPGQVRQVLYTGETFSGLRNCWLVDVAHVIAENHCCGVCMYGYQNRSVKQIKFIGLDDDPLIARELLDYAVSLIKTQARVYRESIPGYRGVKNKNAWTRQFEANFAAGFAAGLRAKYAAQNQQEDHATMTLVSIRPAEVRQFLAGLKTTRIKYRQESRSESAWNDGYQAGQHFNPTKQVTT